MFVQLICKNRNEKEKDEIYEVLGLLCQREHIQIEDKGDTVEIYACPQGTIKAVENEEELILSASTRHAGPGFHAFVVEFFMDVMEEIPGDYELKDDLEYDGNFDRLVQIYEDEIVYLKDVVLNNELVKSQNYMYDETYILPILKENQIATANGLMDVEEFRRLEPIQLMDNFFVWNNWDKDSRFYKNAALLLLAKESVGPYVNMDDHTSKYANAICDYIELAHEDDVNMTLPYKEYKELCHYLSRQVRIKDAKQMEEEVFQYRLKDIYHLFEQGKIVANGCAQRSYDPVSQSLCLMSPYLEDHTWDWLIQAGFQEELCTRKENLLKEEPIHYGNKEIWLQEVDEGSYYTVEAIVKEKENTMYFHCTIASKKDVAYICQCIKESEFQKGIDE